jgi:peptidoglycan/LPS O-acetylase OafA/YrhL
MKNRSADGLRGIAALNVAVMHFLAAFLPAALHHHYPSIFSENKNPSTTFDVLTSPFFSIFYNGHFSVLIFFVLSGYVLTMPYFAQGDTAPLRTRLLGRYFRLNIPIIAAVAVSFAVYQLGLYANVPASRLSGSTVWLSFFFQPGITTATAINEALYQSLVLGTGDLIPPLWTLQIEFIGSIYLLLFYIVKPCRQIVVPALLACVLLYAVHKASSIYYMAIFAGSLLNIARPGERIKPVLLAAGLYFGAFQFQSAFYDMLPSIHFHGVEVFEEKTFYNAIGAVLLTAAVVNGYGARIFENRIAQFLGRVSFSLYLLHFIVLCSLACIIYVGVPRGGLFLAGTFAAYLGACLLAASLFEKYVDRKAIALSRRFTDFVSQRMASGTLSKVRRHPPTER